MLTISDCVRRGEGGESECAREEGCAATSCSRARVEAERVCLHACARGC